MTLRVRLVDLLSGKRVGAEYAALDASQWYSAERLQALQLDKLRALLAYCERSVPFYTAALNAAGVRAADVRSLADLRALPVIDKAIVKQQYDAFIPRGVSLPGPVRVSRTGGTTGEPLAVRKDAQVRSVTEAAMLRYHAWMGIGSGDRKLVVWGAPIVQQPGAARARAWLRRVLTRTRELDSFAIDRASLGPLLPRLRAYRPALVRGYAQSLYELARWLNEAGERLPARAISTTVEPLFPEYRPIFQQAFGAAAFDQYGCGEVEAIAMECAAHAGLHVVEEHVIVELEPDGRVVVTDLDNRASPFIRYANGDVAEWAAGPCPCGRAARRLARILGREGDVVMGVNGRPLHPEFFTHLLNEVGVAERRRLRRYQVVQGDDQSVVWRLVADPLTPDERESLLGHLRRYLGPLPVEIEMVDHIPPSGSGKFRYVVRHGRPGDAGR